MRPKTFLVIEPYPTKNLKSQEHFGQHELSPKHFDPKGSVLMLFGKQLSTENQSNCIFTIATL